MNREKLKRIAQESGVSVSTVQKMLSNTCSFELCKKREVMRLAQKYGYFSEKQPSGPGKTIGVAMPIVPSFFWSVAMEGMNTACEEYKGRVELKYSYYSEFSDETDVLYCLQTLAEREPDGCICVPAPFPKVSGVLASLPVPFGLFNRNEDIPAKLFYIGSDSWQEGIKAAELMHYLTGKSGQVAVLVSKSGNPRAVGFQSWYRERGVEPVVCVVDTSEKLAQAKIARFLQQQGRLAGIYVADGLTHVACQALKKLKSNAVVIGNECTKQDVPFVENKTVKAYFKQDIYMQGYLSVKLMADFLLYGLVPSEQENILSSTVFFNE